MTTKHNGTIFGTKYKIIKLMGVLVIVLQRSNTSRINVYLKGDFSLFFFFLIGLHDMVQVVLFERLRTQKLSNSGLYHFISPNLVQGLKESCIITGLQFNLEC